MWIKYEIFVFNPFFSHFKIASEVISLFLSEELKGIGKAKRIISLTIFPAIL